MQTNAAAFEQYLDRLPEDRREAMKKLRSRIDGDPNHIFFRINGGKEKKSVKLPNSEEKKRSLGVKKFNRGS
jgi:hypothetical protein